MKIMLATQQAPGDSTLHYKLYTRLSLNMQICGCVAIDISEWGIPVYYC